MVYFKAGFGILKEKGDEILDGILVYHHAITGLYPQRKGRRYSFIHLGQGGKRQ